MTDIGSMVAEARRLSGLIDKGVQALRTAAQDAATAEQAYRQARANAWLTVDREATTAREREDVVNSVTSGERAERDLAEGERQAALEALRSRRTQLSALQSILSAMRADQEFHTFQGDAA